MYIQSRKEAFQTHEFAVVIRSVWKFLRLIIDHCSQL